MKILSILLILLPVFVSAQQTLRPAFDTITVDFDSWDEPYRHYAVVADTSRDDYRASSAGNYLSFTGHARAATALVESSVKPKGMDTVRYERFMREYEPVAAVPALLDVASRHEIMIVNEAHHEPRHRVFTRTLLQGLWDRGYRHFGLETLIIPEYVPIDSFVRAEQVMRLNHGFYTRDPQFAALVTEAVRIGFSVFGYEKSGTKGPKCRELGQMRNIMTYRAEHPEGKLLLHVGYSHAYEGELGGRWDKAMAQRLADTTGLDPLTVNQTTFREMATQAREHYEYKRRPVAETSVFVNRAGEPWNFDNETKWFDYYVFHPRTQYRYGRPDYVFTFGRKPFYLDLSEVAAEGPFLIKAYLESNDYRTAVPNDVIEVGGESDRALALAPGRYTLIASVVDGRQFIGRIVVK